MVTQVYSDDNIIVYRWLSTDAKPLGCPHGSRGLEIDTLKRYIYDAPTSVWQDAIVNHDGGDQSPIDAYTKEQTQALLETKVDKQTGMGLSQENYTTAEKEKLSSLSPTTYDQTPTSGSSNPVTSNGIYNALTQKQDHLTFDPTPTANSSRPVTSGGVYQALAGKQGSLVFDQTPTDSSTNPVTSGGIYTDQQRQETEIGVVANAGAKNFLNPNLKSKTVDGVTYTLQSDGRIIANGTATSASFVASFYGGQFTIPAGDWLLNGCPSGGSTASYMVQIKDNSHPENPADGTVLYRDFGTGDVLISISAETAFMYVIRVANGYTTNNLIFKPMIRHASITDSTYVPYALANPVITPALIEQVDNGAKNLFDIQHPSTIRDTSYNVTSDGGIELSCTNATWTQYRVANTPVESGREYAFTLYVDAISGTNTLRVYIRDDNDTGNLLFDSNNISTVKTINTTITSDSGKIWVGIYLNNSATAKTASAKIRAMLCTAADYAVSPKLVPYRPSWQEMWKMIQALQNGA